MAIMMGKTVKESRASDKFMTSIATMIPINETSEPSIESNPELSIISSTSMSLCSRDITRPICVRS